MEKLEKEALRALRETHDQLIAAGISPDEAREIVGAALANAAAEYRASGPLASIPTTG